MADFTTVEMEKAAAEFVFDDFADIPRTYRDLQINGMIGRDAIMPLKMGKEWLFEYTQTLQPNTADQLLKGGKLFVTGKMSQMGPMLSLFLDVNERVVEINCYGSKSNPSSSNFNPKLNSRFQSLPEDISKSYYYRFDGMGIPQHPGPGGGGLYLPSPSSYQWIPASGFLARFHLSKQKLPSLIEKIPDLSYETKRPPSGWANKLMSFLQTPPEKGNHRNIDALFVKNHIQDGIVYLIHNLDVDNMMVLDSPAEALDGYCTHVLSRADGQFDFLKYASKL